MKERASTQILYNPRSSPSHCSQYRYPINSKASRHTRSLSHSSSDSKWSSSTRSSSEKHGDYKRYRLKHRKYLSSHYDAIAKACRVDHITPLDPACIHIILIYLILNLVLVTAPSTADLHSLSRKYFSHDALSLSHACRLHFVLLLKMVVILTTTNKDQHDTASHATAMTKLLINNDSFR